MFPYRNYFPAWLPTLGLLILALSLQACSSTVTIESGAISLPCPPGSGVGNAPPHDPKEGGCDPAAPNSQDATGYVGIGGPNPVPTNDPPYTCSSTSSPCANPGQSGCNLRSPSKRCTNTFTYPASGTIGTCGCACQ